MKLTDVWHEPASPDTDEVSERNYTLQEAMESFSHKVKHIAVKTFMEMCQLQAQIMSKVLKQSPWNQVQQQLKEHSYQERYYSYLCC